MREEKRKYGLLMSIAMVIGIVIGSGIFFKADDILIMTNGNVAIGAIVLAVGAGGIIFGGITIAEWAKLTDDAGGLISYGEHAYDRRFSFLVGWFQMVVYYPALAAVIAWVGANYTLQLFSNISFIQDKVWLVAIAYIIILYTINTFSTKIAGYLQTSAMFIKLIPLLVIGIAGILFGDVHSFSLATLDQEAFVAGSSAIVAAAFSYDGWSIAPTICHEIKDAKRNLPLALIIAPLIILIMYLIYFLGITFLLGPDQVMQLQDQAFEVAAMRVVGTGGAKILLVGVVVSVIGTLNGIILGSCRVPHALAIRNDLPKSDQIAELHERYDVSFSSHTISFCLTLGWLLLHYLSLEHPFFQTYQMDVSGLPIVLMYIFYFLLYAAVIRYAYKGNIKSIFFGYVAPTLAMLGAAIVIWGGLTSANGIMYLVISIICLTSGYLMYKGMH